MFWSTRVLRYHSILSFRKPLRILLFLSGKSWCNCKHTIEISHMILKGFFTQGWTSFPWCITWCLQSSWCCPSSSALCSWPLQPWCNWLPFCIKQNRFIYAISNCNFTSFLASWCFGCILACFCRSGICLLTGQNLELIYVKSTRTKAEARHLQLGQLSCTGDVNTPTRATREIRSRKTSALRSVSL